MNKESNVCVFIQIFLVNFHLVRSVKRHGMNKFITFSKNYKYIYGSNVNLFMKWIDKKILS